MIEPLVPELKAGQRWIYAGPGDGHGMPHLITSVTRMEGEEMITVTTWGEQYRPSRDVRVLGSGDTWMGPLPDFLTQFRGPINPPPKT